VSAYFHETYLSVEASESNLLTSRGIDGSFTGNCSRMAIIETNPGRLPDASPGKFRAVDVDA